MGLATKMTQEVTLETIHVIARKQDEMRLPSEGPAEHTPNVTPIDIQRARERADWLLTPSSLRGGYELEHAFDVSVERSDGTIFSDYHLVYVRQDGMAALVRQTLVRDYPSGPEGSSQVSIYGRLEPIDVGGHAGALLTLTEMTISESARVPPLARVYVERQGVLLEIDGSPAHVSELREVAHNFLES